MLWIITASLVLEVGLFLSPWDFYFSVGNLGGKSRSFLDMIAIYSTNRYEYDVVILGGYQANITNVALYDTLGLVFISY